MIWGDPEEIDKKEFGKKKLDGLPPRKKNWKGLLQEKISLQGPSPGKRPSARKKLERLSREKNKFIFKFSSAPQIINEPPLGIIPEQGASPI